MYPYLFKNENLSIYSILMIVGIFSAIFLFRILSTKKGITDYGYSVISKIILVAIIIGLLGSRLFQMLYNFIKTGKVGDGITFMGGLMSGVATFFAIYSIVYKRVNKHKREVLLSDLKKSVNIAAPCIAIGHALGRVGCFFAGCCYGKPTDMWFGVDFVQSINTKTGEWNYFGYKRIPTQLFEAIFLVVVFVLCMIALKRDKGNLSLKIYMYGYSIFRFILEFFRGDEERAVVGILSPSQWQSIVLFALALSVTIIPLLVKSKEEQCREKENLQQNSAQSYEEVMQS